MFWDVTFGIILSLKKNTRLTFFRYSQINIPEGIDDKFFTLFQNRVKNYPSVNFLTKQKLIAALSNVSIFPEHFDGINCGKGAK